MALVGSLFLPWFGTSDANEHSRLAGVSRGDTVNAWQTFSLLDILLVVALLACLGMAASGYLRQSRYKEGRKPPGVI